MRDMNILDEAEHEIYLQFYDYLVKMNKIVDLFGIIYIQCSPEICKTRILKRSREGEEGIPLDYLNRIHDKHEDWLIKNQNERDHVLVIDNTIQIDESAIISSIAAWILKKGTSWLP